MGVGFSAVFPLTDDRDLGLLSRIEVLLEIRPCVCACMCLMHNRLAFHGCKLIKDAGEWSVRREDWGSLWELSCDMNHAATAGSVSIKQSLDSRSGLIDAGDFEQAGGVLVLGVDDYQDGVSQGRLVVFDAKQSSEGLQVGSVG